jgi:hypothetical protein
MRSPPGDDLRMGLPVPFGAFPTGETTARPLKLGGPALGGQITHPDTTMIMHPAGLESAVRATDHPTDIGHLDHQPLHQVDHNGDHPDTPQMQTNGHTIGLHQGPFHAR